MRTLTLLLAITWFAAGVQAQGHGRAPLFFPPQQKYTNGIEDPGYSLFYASHLYPLSYLGDVWTGMVTAIHGPEISLAWTDKKGKIESFTGVVVHSYQVPTVRGGRTGPVSVGTQTLLVPPPAQNLIGQNVVVYYITDAKKVEKNGKKVKVTTNYIFRLDPQNGKP